jgi:hypothetical protein
MSNKIIFEPDVAVHACYPSTCKTEVGGHEFEAMLSHRVISGRCGLHGETLFKNKQQQKKKKKDNI